jgi:hypothetical protein
MKRLLVADGGSTPDPECSPSAIHYQDQKVVFHNGHMRVTTLRNDARPVMPRSNDTKTFGRPAHLTNHHRGLKGLRLYNLAHFLREIA